MKIVILAGGAGTRLWPMSTSSIPKQFQSLVSEKTLLQETYDRVKWAGSENIYISTNEQYKDLVLDQLPEVNIKNIILEPSLKDTSACLGLAASVISKDFPNAVMAIVYADHLVQDAQEFKDKLMVANKIAEAGDYFCIVEVKAKTPNTGLGYVKIGKKLTEISGHEVYSLIEFKEKPDIETAKEFIQDGNYLWNTGFYVWRVDTLLNAFKEFLPNTYKCLEMIKDGADLTEYYNKCDKISIDYGIMEKIDSNKIRIIPAELGWSDIGTWNSIFEELFIDANANLEKGLVFAKDSDGNLIYNQTGLPLAVIGIKNSIIVQTHQGTLVSSMQDSSKLKDVLQMMQN